MKFLQGIEGIPGEKGATGDIGVPGIVGERGVKVCMYINDSSFTLTRPGFTSPRI